ncbi:non-ribosomal peptide synthase/polyketide synthase [Micromonospora zamorensis]|uniref:non-ribosomal peptide synthetase n=1 Tax=Micromonospora zamorensis TaxID=709883 RepID=UPI002E2D0377|nr:non-ribosomal peptide synthase/polyketide synthase [Micromonospora zamorensis]
MTSIANEPNLREELVQRRLAGRRTGRRDRIPTVDRSGELPLSYGQQQMWFLNRMDPTSAEFLVSSALRLRGQLDADALGRALDTLVARHEILRTRYALAGTAPVQVIDPPTRHDLPVVDLTDRPRAEREAALDAVLADSALTGFDLARDWPVRAVLVRLDSEEHVLALVLHHIACDAPSLAVLTGELAELYAALRVGVEPWLPAPAVQFADFAAWQRGRLRAEPVARSLDYWRDQLAGLTPVELPADRTRPKSRDWRGSSVPFTLTAELSAALRGVARDAGTTVFVTLLSAYEVLLSRYTGRTDLAVGTVSSARSRAELHNLVGYGIDNLVLRARWSDDPSFAELLEQTRDTVLGAFDHADAPFALLADELEPERDLSRTPLYQVAFTLQSEPPTTDWPGDLRVEPVELPLRSSKVDLTLHMMEGTDGGLRGRIEYATALFEPATVERAADHLVRLLEQVATDPTARLSDLAILGAAELAVVTRGPVTADPVTGTVHGVFEATAAAHPDAVALTVGDTTCSYAELNAAANRLAHWLRGHGAGPERLVGVQLDHGPELVPALLGVLKSGAAYLPLDPASPDERLDFMISDAGAEIVLTTTAHRDRFADFGGTVVLLDDPDLVAELAAQPTVDPAVPTDVDNLCYVIYTSGSTGRPKGVAVAHRQVLRLLTVTAGDYRFGPDDVWTLLHSYAFDFSVWEIWGCLLHGGRLLVVPRTLARSPQELLDELIAQRVTVLCQTPTAFRGLVRLAAEGDARVDQLALRVVTFGGEKLDFADLAPWVASRGVDAPQLINMYGITETTVHTTFHRVAAAEVGGTASRIGVPLADLTVHLLDVDGRPVPIGVPGEIHVGGPGVARGYLGRADLTAQRFVPDPWGPAGSRLYRSGDLARRHADGGLEFVGRIDHQVKIRGYRVELGEIEAALTVLPGVRDAVVVLREDNPGDQRLTAYLVADDTSTLLRPSQLRAALGRTLPDYMVPAAFMPLPRIPLTVNGKLDQAALPAPGRSVAAVDRPYVAPRTTVEQQLADVWTATLGLDRVGVQDGFFDLGGDSIRAVALAGALRAAHFDVEVRDIFERRTVAELAELLTARPATDPEPTVAPFELVGEADRAVLPADVVDAYPCTQGQLGMLVELLSDTEQNPYHNVTSYRVHGEGEFSLDALRAAAALLVRRHEVLRTSFDLTSYSVPMQLVHATAELTVTHDHARTTERAELDRELRDHIAVERARLFDLDRPSLLRLHARTCADGSWWLTITECHPILDGWSYHSLIMELVRAYHQIRAGEPLSPQPIPSVRFADAVAAERRSVTGDADRAFWRDVLTGRVRHDLPTGWGDPDAPEGAKHEHWVPVQDLEASLRDLARRLGVPFKSVMLAAHLKVMSQLTGAEGFYTGLVCNIRPEAAGADRVYGMHLNTVPVGYDGPAATWEELIQRTFAAEVELWPHRRYPLSTLQREVGEDARMLDVRFSFHDFHQIDADDIDYAESIDDSPTEFPLGVFSRLGFLTLQASQRNVGHDALRRLGAMYRVVLEAMVADPGADARVVCLPAGEVSVLLADGDGVVEPLSGSVPEWFEEQVSRVPSAVAVNGVPFAELDARAADVGSWLVSRGVSRGSVVGVLLDRGVDLVAALLGVWKAGAAFVPLDPSYPVGRVEAMLVDAGASVLVTSSGYSDRCPAGVEVLSVEVVPSAGSSRMVLPGVVDLDDLAYVIFTSGSTGRPKGVQVTHRGLANHVRWASVELAGRGSGGSAVFSSVAFDLQVPNVWAPLVVGERVLMVDQDVDLAELGSVLSAAGPFSFLKLTPGHLEILGRQLSDELLAGLAPVVVVAGEGLPAALANRWLGILGPGNLINEYGPTEASVGTCVFPVRVEQTLPVVPIGRALPGMRMFVLDSWMNLVPVGVVGELFVGGVGVARGYVGQSGLTADRFVPDPFGPAGSRLYRTGDLVRRLADGAVEFVGRVDHQVKVRGYRIELGEIESVIGAVAGVRDVVALVHGEGSRLVACYVPDGPDVGLSERVQRECASRLPEYMIPADLVVVESIPLNANGKVDRAALAASMTGGGRVHVDPRTDLERQLAEIWARVLNLDTVSVVDSFFDLGGHSISAIALVGALRTAGIPASVRDVFLHRTVAALAANLEAERTPAEPEFQPVAPFALLDDADRASLPAGLTDAYPIAQVQLGMLVKTMTDTERHTYHNVSAFPIHDEQPLVPDALRRAVQTVVDRHEILRTSFDLNSYSVPLQLVHAEVPIEVTELDLRGPDTEARMSAFMAAERANPFAPDQVPQMRVAGAIGEGTAWWFVLTMSHGILEGWSHHSLLMEILDNYRLLRDTAAPVPADALPVRYADFVAAELAALTSAEDEAYWRGVVEYPRFALPTGWGAPDSDPQFQCGTRVPLHDLLDGLRNLASSTGTALKSVLLAAHLKVMSQITVEPVFTSGLVCHGRPEVTGADQVYGMHLNTLPIVHRGPAATWTELIRQTFDAELELWPHRHYPLPSVQRFTDGDRPIEILFNYLDFAQVDTDRVGFDDAVYEASSEFDLHVSTLDGTLSILSDPHVVSYPNVLRLGAMYRVVLEAMVADPGADARVVCLPAGEVSVLLADGDGVVEPLSGSVPEWFEEQVSRVPSAVAVNGVPFAELDARAADVGSWLVSRGVSRGSVVGVLLDRGVDLVAALLGVWKAGAAFVPLDPSYPVGRVEAMLVDAGASVLVTSSGYSDRCPAGVEVLSVEVVPSAGSSRMVLPGVVDLDDLAYVIFTSGSTGRPKGVQVTHRGLANHVRWASVELAGRGSGGSAVFSSVAFDLQVPNVWAPLVVGERVLMVDQDVDLAELGSVLSAAGPFSFLKLTPGHLEILGRQLSDELLAGLAPVVVVAGEGLPAALANRWLGILGPGNLINEYGPTEASVGTCVFPVRVEQTLPVVPIGRALPGMRMFVLDSWMNLVPVGVVGELFVGGVGVARGYVGQSGLTADRFVPDPFGPAGSRLYRTGDLVRRLADGAVEFVGRVDHQVKVRGYRIELGEIESVIGAVAGVRDTVALVHPEEARLLAFYVPEGPDAGLAARVRQECVSRLPEYMIPADLVVVESIPLNANGKVDRAALAASVGETNRVHVAPRTDLERQLAEIWARVLNLDTVSVVDSFFDLGGDSLRAVALVGALRGAGFPVGVRDVFVHRTVTALAAHLAAKDSAEVAPEFTPVAPFALLDDADRASLPAGLTDAYPIAQVQIGMLVEIQKDPTRSLYHIVRCFRVHSRQAFSGEALTAAVQDIVGRHETLRTSFDPHTYTVPLQLVHAHAPVDVRILRLDEERAEAHLRGYVDAERARPFDPEHPAPLLRVSAHVGADGGWWLTVAISHLVTGGWDLNALLAELLSCYERRCVGMAPEAPEPIAVRYADFVAGERAALASAADEAYWRTVTSDYARFTPPAGWGDESAAPGTVLRHRLSYQDLDPRIRELASTYEVSPKAVLHAAHLKVMSQLTDERRFYTGLVCDARPEVRGAERVHGMYINVLPFGHERGGGSWRDLVRSVFDREVELWPHRRFPLPAVRRLTGADAHPIDVVFDYTEFRRANTDSEEQVGFEAVAGEGGTEFALQVTAASGFLDLVADARVFGSVGLVRLAGMFRVVLESMVADPGGDSRVVCVPSGEAEWLSRVGVGAVVPVSGVVCSAFEARAASAGGAVAISGGGVSLSYGELNAAANRLARYLRSVGVGAEVLVGVCVHRSVEQVVAMLAVHKAGGVYVPLDPGYPAERLGLMVADAGASVVVTSSGLVSGLAGLAAEVVLVDRPGLWAGESGADVPPVVGPDNACYVIYTSGSTGRPKGAVVTHAGLVNRTAHVAPTINRLVADGVILQKTEIGFDVSPAEVYAALSTGARIVVARPGGHRDPAYLRDTIIAESVTSIELVPSMLSALLAEGVSDCTSLRSVAVGGEELPVDVARAFLAALPDCELHNTYGPAETTVDVTSWHCTSDDLADVSRVPLGRPFPNITLRVLDDQFQPVPIGAPGELCVAGVGVGRGYLGAAGLTADRFVPDPFGSVGSRLYRTGDAVAWRSDGTVEFLGRLDAQVKLRGVRVELGEVESALRSCVGVRDAVASVVEVGGRRVLAGYVVPVGSGVDVVGVRGVLRGVLPEVLVPSVVMVVDVVPVDVNGKVDRRQLPVPSVVVDPVGVFVAPVSVVERAVAGVWARVLGCEVVGVESSFFDLGGDSMLAVSLVGALRAAGYSTSVRDVFAYRTVRGLAASLGDGVDEWVPVAPFALLADSDRAALPDGLTDAYPATQAQVGMAVEIAKDDAARPYHIVHTMRVDDGMPFDVEPLRATLAELVARHDTLRTSFDLTGFSVPMQLVHAEAQVPVVVHAEATGHPAYVAAERDRPFDLATPPLLRVAVHREDDRAWWLTVSVSHLITGGWDLNLLLADLRDGYHRRRRSEQPTPAEPVAVRYADFVAAELSALDSETDADYWRDVVTGRPKFTLPDTLATEAVPRQVCRTELDIADLDPALRGLASSLGVPVKAVLHAAHLKVMSQLTDERRFYTGLVCDARPEVRGAERVHGMYINVLPFGHERGGGSWRDLVWSVFDREVELWPHRRFPLPAVRRLTGVDTHPVDVVFGYTEPRTDPSGEKGAGGPTPDGLTARADDATDERTASDVAATEFLLSVGASPTVIRLVGDGRVFGSVGLVRLAGMFRVVLESMVADPGGDSRVVCVPSGEAEWLSRVGVGRVAPVEGVAYSAFEAQMGVRPDAVAVCDGGMSLSYGELNAAANRLARYLRSVGVGAEVLVGVCVHRSVEQVVAMLAVHKAGGVYVPLDPGYPAERLGLMVADAGASVVVTSSGLVSGLSGLAAEVVLVDRPGLWAGESGADVPPVVGPDNACYVIYTSGSTGRPKGAVVTHAGLVNRTAHVLPEVYRLGPDCVVLQKTEIGFDVSPAEVYAALSAGARIVVARPGGHRDPAYLRDLIIAEQVTTVHFVPAMLSAMLAEGFERCTSLRSVGVGGEELPVDVARAFLAALPHCELHNTYGPAEAAVDVTSWRCDSEALAELTRVPLGGPHPNLRLYVLDEDLAMVPIGVPGELYLGGVGVGRGYLGAAGLTADRFVPDPFGSVGSRLYRTGDAVAWRSDGTVEFLGRLDAQVKLRGVRVELGEVESALRSCVGVRDAVASVVEVGGRRVLAGYVVPVGSGVDVVGVRGVLRGVLPEVLVPSVVMVVDVVPVDVNGKVDRRQLPVPSVVVDPVGVFVAPVSVVERAVAGVWARVLGREVVGVESSFFDLGGDSMLAVSLVGALRAAGYSTSVRDVFAFRTVRGLAASLGGVEDSWVPVQPFALLGDADRNALPAGLTDAYPAAQTQLGMLVELATSGGRAAYHSVIAHQVRDGRPFSADALRAAVATIVTRHEILRTSFDLTGYSVPMQLVHAEVTPQVTVVDGRDVPADQQVRLFEEFVATERATPFDLAVAPLLRVAAHQDGDASWWLSFTICHAVTEGWSSAQLLADLLAVYADLADGRSPTETEQPSVRYADFIAAELSALASDEDRDYWRAVVDGHSPFVLPAGWGEPGDPTTISTTVDVADLDEAVARFASESGVSVKAVLHAAHLKVLSQLTTEQSFHAGLVCDARPEVLGADRVQGMYLNTLPFGYERTARTWRDLVTAVFDREVDLWPHRRFPLAEIQRGSGQRLLRVLFNYQDFSRAGQSATATGTEPVVVGSAGDGATEFELSVFAHRGDYQLSSRSDVLSRANLERLAGMYRAVLAAMIADPGGDAQAVHLPGGERERLLGVVDTGVEEPVTGTVVELFEARVVAAPDAVAVVAGPTRLTYAQVNAQANRLAGHLRAAGVGRGAVVGVCLDRGADLVPALLGVLKAGAAYLPLDPTQPAERIAYLLSDAAAGTVVATGAHVDALAGYDGHLVLLDRTDLTGHPETDPAPVNDADDPLYVIYTSGSTGRPKGVCVSHANVLRLLDSAQEHYATDETDVVALFHSYAFDVSVWELWGALLHGSRLVVVPSAVARVPEDLLDLLVEQEVTLLAQTPTAFRGLVRLAADGDQRLRRLVLRAVVLAGERLDFADLAPWVDRLGLARIALVNMYGITETTVYSTYHRVTRADLAAGVGSRIGRPLAGLRMYVLDQQGHPTPLGVPGEIHLAGHGVARGYLNQPALTAQRFLPDPYGPAGNRMYRTGDLGIRLPDGSVEFLGRLDDQVKLRGYRIELGEVESALAALPEVAEAAVVLREDTAGDPRLVGYLAGAPGQRPSTGELRAALARTLPDYMIPAAFVTLDQLPRNNSGKLDRRALPAPQDGDPGDGRAMVGPRTALEERVAGIWAQVLGLPAVGVEDGFFELGGHSIKALVLASTLRTAGLDVSVADVMDLQTVSRLCAVLVDRTGPVHVDRPVEPFELVSAPDRALLPDGLSDAYPLSQVQLGMLLEMLADNGWNHYHNVTSFLVREDDPLDLATLREAVDLVVNRHEVLRSSVDPTGYSVPMQLVHPAVRVPVVPHDLRGLSEEDREAELRRLVAVEYASPFDVELAPLLRFAVCRETDRSWRLVLTICHVVVEGWSLHALVAEILDRYRSMRVGAGPEPEPLPEVRFADFIAEERRALESAADRRYWQDLMDRCAKFTFPTGWQPTSPPQARTAHTARVPFRDLEPGLRALASAARVSLKAVLHAAHLTVLGQLTDEPRFYSGLVCHTRPDMAGSERVYAMSLNTLPFPYERDCATWTELVRRVHATEVEMWPHRRYPAPAIRPAVSGTRLLDVYFSYLDFDEVVGEHVDAGPRYAAASSEFTLAVSAVAGHLELSSDSDCLERAEVERLAAMYRLVLDAMVADPDGDARAVRLPEAERHNVLVAWAGATDGNAPEPGLVPDLVRERAATAGDAEAVGELSYAGLDAAANRLGWHLRERGVGPERVVGVLLDRGADLVTTLLGIWRAGGAYLPIDPSYPPARIASMLTQAGATVVVTSTAYVDRFTGVDRVLLDVDAGPIADCPDEQPPGRIDPDQLAYVIFTSGSTGRPNGVQVSHRSLAGYLNWAVDELVADRVGGAALFSSVAFDMVVTTIWAPLVAGQRLWLMPADAGLDELGPRLAAAGPFSFVKLTPSHLDLLAGQLSREQAAALTPVLVLGGEALTARTCARWQKLAPRTVLLNEYGPTEATVAVSRYPVTGALTGQVAPVGRPLGGMRTYVLDARLNPVPVGAVGEVYLGGPQLARGYAGRPEHTAARFVPDPYGPAGSRLYRTGDRGRWLPDGQLDLLGRVDDQVKIRGHRVEPGEIRAVLLEHSAVRDAAVVARPAPGGGNQLIAYHVGGADDLAGHCARRLPAALVPAAFVPVDAIALNPNGKVDLRALPAAPLRTDAEIAPPQGPVETILAGIWAEVLDVPGVGRQDRFFALGGHSLLVVPVVTAARQAGLPLTLQQAMLDQPLADLAAALTVARTARAVALPRIAPLPQVAPLLAEARVPGASLAVLADGELVQVLAVGHCATGGDAPVTPATIFQVGSVSKLVAAVGALALVDRGALQLDADVNAYLKAWQLPAERPVTLRQLLSHVAGLTSTGSSGHPRGGPVPPLSDLLLGRGVPTGPVRTLDAPDPVAVERNSHFVVVQQLMEDVAATPFADLMAELVFAPLGMTGSSFDQSFPETSGRPVAAGHDERGEPHPHGWEVRADLAAAGLWTTATDLAALTREIQTAYRGDPALLSQETVRAQLTAGPGGIFGLGCMVDRIEGSAGTHVEFTHRGHIAGYRALVTGRVPDGAGLVLLTNGEAGDEVMSLLMSNTARTEDM